MRKGYKKEWELFHLLWKKGFSVVRVAGSGSTTMPACDLVAGNKKKKLAIEVKSGRKNKIYVDKRKINQLIEFSEKFGAKPLIIVNFYRKGWYVFDIKNLENSGNFFICDINKGKKLE